MSQLTQLVISGLLLLQPKVYTDQRGYFFEVNRRSELQQALGDIEFVQESQSGSVQHELRGLNYQLNKPQAKLIRVLIGHIFDVVVDLRRGSSCFGQRFGMELCSEKKQQLFVPAGFAHGFLTLSPYAEVVYKTDQYYNPASECAVRWDDPDLGIQWPLTKAPLLSAKDSQAPSFASVKMGSDHITC
jgi:dTDP-4-dehydrorhamnose 3,5-epimerase